MSKFCAGEGFSFDLYFSVTSIRTAAPLLSHRRMSSRSHRTLRPVRHRRRRSTPIRGWYARDNSSGKKKKHTYSTPSGLCVHLHVTTTDDSPYDTFTVVLHYFCGAAIVSRREHTLGALLGSADAKCAHIIIYTSSTKHISGGFNFPAIGRAPTAFCSRGLDPAAAFIPQQILTLYPHKFAISDMTGTQQFYCCNRALVSEWSRDCERW